MDDITDKEIGRAKTAAGDLTGNSSLRREGSKDEEKGDGMDIYLNDHLAGAMLGSGLAEQIRDHAEGTPLGDVIAPIATEIEEDRQTLLDLMDAMGTRPNPIKKATGWLAEKASRAKFSGATSGEPDHGLFMALESLRLGVAGKKCLWIALQQVRGDYEVLTNMNLERLLERATTQERTLEEERLKIAAQALGSSPSAAG